ncbi:MAG TPA: holo-ACP synthase [Fimbriimonadaceae bacterium]|nr:holo-ACP synthase [Fimbriimonadaceae bacterium]
MICGLGVDLVEVSRIRRAMQEERFLPRILTATERAEVLSPERVAGRWAAKEAAAKAVGTFLRWHDVEILNLPSGQPVARIRPGAFDMRGFALHISISHVKEHAVAVAVLERTEDSSRA